MKNVIKLPAPHNSGRKDRRVSPSINRKPGTETSKYLIEFYKIQERSTAHLSLCGHNASPYGRYAVTAAISAYGREGEFPAKSESGYWHPPVFI